jgi:hypothetical protein
MIRSNRVGYQRFGASRTKRVVTIFPEGGAGKENLWPPYGL